MDDQLVKDLLELFQLGVQMPSQLDKGEDLIDLSLEFGLGNLAHEGIVLGHPLEKLFSGEFR